MKIYLCSYLNPLSDKKCEFVKQGAVVIENGLFIDKGIDYKILKKYQKCNALVVNWSGKLMMPSFFDMHFHWVQDDVRLMPKDSLLEWLKKYTWPYEEKFKSLDYTKKKVQKFKEELLAVGTLGGACFASIHPHTVELAIEKFIGDFTIGNVLMTMNSPADLCQTDQEAIETVLKLSPKFKKKYALTPRFAPTTSPAVMKKTAIIAKKNNSFIQTHLSETQNEIDYVLEIYKAMDGFKKVKNYTEIYHKCGILSSKTILGHGIYLSKDELQLLKKTKSAIAHCPTSNGPVKDQGLGSGLFNFKLTEKYKIPWALGSDIGGGPYLSMFDVMNSFVLQNKKKNILEATFTKALYHATLAGAKILKIDKETGNLEKKKAANFIVLQTPHYKTGDNAEDILKKIVKNLMKNRSHADQLIEMTFYKDQNVYARNSKIIGQ